MSEEENRERILAQAKPLWARDFNVRKNAFARIAGNPWGEARSRNMPQPYMASSLMLQFAIEEVHERLHRVVKAISQAIETTELPASRDLLRSIFHDLYIPATAEADIEQGLEQQLRNQGGAWPNPSYTPYLSNFANSKDLEVQGAFAELDLLAQNHARKATITTRGTMMNQGRDELRALVLHAFYDINEKTAGGAEQTGVIAERISREESDVNRAALYLAERGLLEITHKLAHSDGLVAIMAKITSFGIDVIERPEQGSGVLDSALLQRITIINGTQVSGGTVYQGSQHIAGNNSGTMVNASQTGDIITTPSTPFPIERLREIVYEGTSERDAIETLNQEYRTAHPKLSRVTNAIEVVKESVSFAEAAKIVIEWFKTPDVVAWFQHLTSIF